MRPTRRSAACRAHNPPPLRLRRGRRPPPGGDHHHRCAAAGARPATPRRPCARAILRPHGAPASPAPHPPPAKHAPMRRMRSRKEWPAAAPFALPADARLDSSSACPMPRSGASAASEDDLDETELWGDDGPAPCAEAAPPTRTTPRGHSRSPSPSLSLSDADRDDAGRPSTDSLAPLRGAPMAIVGSASPSRAGGALGRRRPVAASLPRARAPWAHPCPSASPAPPWRAGRGAAGRSTRQRLPGPASVRPRSCRLTSYTPPWRGQGLADCSWPASRPPRRSNGTGCSNEPPSSAQPAFSNRPPPPFHTPSSPNSTA